jgi:hypothetical protein
VTILISAWGALIPFVEPLFGYHVTGTPSWHWNAAHTLLAVVPGGVGMVMGFVVLRGADHAQVGRGRMRMILAGLITLLCGAWFIVGPTAWPVISTHGAYFAPAAPLRSLLHQVGYAIGTGAILAVCGGYVLGWASRPPIRASAAAGSNGSPAPMVDSPELVVAPPPTRAPVPSGPTASRPGFKHSFGLRPSQPLIPPSRLLVRCRAVTGSPGSRPQPIK